MINPWIGFKILNLSEQRLCINIAQSGDLVIFMINLVNIDYQVKWFDRNLVFRSLFCQMAEFSLHAVRSFCHICIFVSNQTKVKLNIKTWWILWVAWYFLRLFAGCLVCAHVFAYIILPPYKVRTDISALKMRCLKP